MEYEGLTRYHQEVYVNPNNNPNRGLVLNNRINFINSSKARIAHMLL